MYAAQMEAYQRTQKATMSGREVEALVLTKAALKLRECQENWQRPDCTTRLDEALKFNQKVWTIFQGELSKAENPLPKKLREDILSLSAFIDKRIFDVIAYPSPEKLTAIIKINLNLAAGLRGTPN